MAASTGSRGTPEGRVIDVTLGISPDMLRWPGDPVVALTAHPVVDGSRVSTLGLGTHTGTHVDPPFHFLADGATIDALDLDVLVGPCVVADLRGATDAIGPRELEALALPERTTRLLMRTSNSAIWTTPVPVFPDDYVAMTAEGARWCVDHGIRLVGTDFLSIEQRNASGHPVHRLLLSHGVVIVEGLVLGGVEPGAYEVAVLPLKIIGGDGAPARAVLVRR